MRPDDLLADVQASRKFAWLRQVKRLNSPVDRDEWYMNPQTVNASYNPNVNDMTFPAGILQPPFFDPAADPAVNYGSIGAVIVLLVWMYLLALIALFGCEYNAIRERLLD